MSDVTSAELAARIDYLESELSGAIAILASLRRAAKDLCDELGDVNSNRLRMLIQDVDSSVIEAQGCIEGAAQPLVIS